MEKCDQLEGVVNEKSGKQKVGDLSISIKLNPICSWLRGGDFHFMG